MSAVQHALNVLEQCPVKFNELLSTGWYMTELVVDAGEEKPLTLPFSMHQLPNLFLKG